MVPSALCRQKQRLQVYGHERTFNVLVIRRARRLATASSHGGRRPRSACAVLPRSVHLCGFRHRVRRRGFQQGSRCGSLRNASALLPLDPLILQPGVREGEEDLTSCSLAPPRSYFCPGGGMRSRSGDAAALLSRCLRGRWLRAGLRAPETA